MHRSPVATIRSSSFPSLAFIGVRPALALVTTLVVAAMGCTGGGGGGGATEAGVIVLDSGLPPPPDGGLDAGSDGGIDDGGLNDAGGIYEGIAEEGVMCGAPLSACADGVPCCVAITGFAPSITTAGGCAPIVDAGPPMCAAGPIPAFSFGCDDTSIDCDVDQVCCFTGLFDAATFNIDVRSSCRAPTECVGEADAEVCTSTADCAADQLCCGGGGLGIPLPVDFGICAASCELDLPDGGLPDSGANDAG